MNRYAQYVNTEELKKTRLKKKRTYEDMSKAIGLKSPISYYNIEVGFVEPKISQMVKISDTLGRPVHKFFNFKLQEN